MKCQQYGSDLTRPHGSNKKIHTAKALTLAVFAAEWLLKTDLIINHNAEQVVALLGKPKASEKSDFSYALGQCSGFGWLNSILVVKFENDLVTQLSIERGAP